MARDYYAELGVEPSASTDDIKQAYRVLARKYHPDTSADRETAARFTAVTEAYHTLTDPRRRLAYNQTQLAERQQSTSTAKIRSITKNELRAAIGRAAFYAVTATLFSLAIFYFTRWLANTPIIYIPQFTGPVAVVGLLLGLMWGIDANFVLGDFISTPMLWLVRLSRLLLWGFGLNFLAKTFLFQVATGNIGRYGALTTDRISLAAIGIGLGIAFIATLRDH